jgi:hypothetical protein
VLVLGAPAQPYLLCDVAWVTNGLGGVGSSADEAPQAGTIRGRALAAGMRGLKQLLRASKRQPFPVGVGVCADAGEEVGD